MEGTFNGILMHCGIYDKARIACALNHWTADTSLANSFVLKSILWIGTAKRSFVLFSSWKSDFSSDYCVLVKDRRTNLSPLEFTISPL